ncbi:MAG: malate dehydrogenase [Candidatus Moranbacteria bacterium]|nr:malate dehydrogenase [Candidatus Moranbacteria bacterium]
MKEIKNSALEYHGKNPPGKIATKITKSCRNQRDLSLAYSPGVAEVSMAIAKNPKRLNQYTNRGNYIAVITDGSAILGLGDLGPEAAYPVMEGKALLFKKFADVDASPICLNIAGADDSAKKKRLVKTVKALEPTFGGINLEDIKAPACFEIEQQLKKNLKIPVFHDDQHGTAIITLAALFNALELTGKRIQEVKCVFLGAGAAGIATASLFARAGVLKRNIIMSDSTGILHQDRKKNMNKYKRQWATKIQCRSLKQAMRGADVFVGVSGRDLVTQAMVKSMNVKPIIFAMANPWPEIKPEKAKQAGAFVVGTGRSDYENQINNVLGFPGVFRGVLDTHAREINDQMKIAAAQALAQLAKEPIPAKVKNELKRAYAKEAKHGIFDQKNPLAPNYVIPKPLDSRVAPRVAREVAKAAMETRVAQKSIENRTKYEKQIAMRLAAV